MQFNYKLNKEIKQKLSEQDSFFCAKKKGRI